MTNHIRPGLENSLVNKLADDFFFARSNFYYFLGKVEPWVGTYSDVPFNTELDETLIRDNLLYMKKISTSDISISAKRYDWLNINEFRSFDEWDHSIDMSDKMFYCMTDEFNVYKCLDNHGGSISTIKPSGISVFPFRLSDGYLWKFMYSIQEFKQTKFLSPDYMPVQRALSNSFYNHGAVEDVVIIDGGSNYIEDIMTTISVGSTTTTGSGASIAIDSVDDFGRIESLEILNAGQNYTAGAIIELESEFGQEAVITAIITAGHIVGFDIVNPGFGYNIDDPVNVLVGQAQLTPIVSRETGEIVDVIISNPGVGYASAPILTVNQYPVTGTGKYGHSFAIVKAFVYEGEIVECTIEDPGQNYPVDTATMISVIGDGTGAMFTPVIREGHLVDVIVENSGTNYTFINLNVTGAGSGAEIIGIIGASDLMSQQSIVEQYSVPGAIYNAKVTVPGDHYTSSTIMSIDGDGTGAEGYPVIVNGGIDHIVMTSFGEGYSRASITFSDPNRESLSVYINAEGYTILSPINGHGFDAPRELFGNTLSVFTILSNELELTLLDQDCRQFGLIENPTNRIDQKRITESSVFVVFKIIFNTLDGLNPDDVIVSNKKRYRVVSLDQDTNMVTLQQLSSIFAMPDSVFYKESDQALTYNPITIESVPSVDKYSGQILYAINSEPFALFPELIFAIRTNIRFSDQNIL